MEIDMICRMADGSELHTPEELREYGRRHKLPASALQILADLCAGAPPEESG